MNKVKCKECGTELVSECRYNFVICSCPNEAFTDGGESYQKIGAKDLSKILIWDDDSKTFENTVM